MHLVSMTSKRSVRREMQTQIWWNDVPSHWIHSLWYMCDVHAFSISCFLL